MADFNGMRWTEGLTADVMKERLDAVNLDQDVLKTVESVSIDFNSIF